MEHPKVFEAADPVVARVRAICVDYPEFAEVEAWGRPTFRAGKKLFVVMGSSMDRPHTMVFKPDPDERPALLDDGERLHGDGERTHVPDRAEAVEDFQAQRGEAPGRRAGLDRGAGHGPGTRPRR